jgi:hypothetical protein
MAAPATVTPLTDPAALTRMAEAAMANALAQVGKPLSVSVAGRTVDYGSAAEAMQAAEAFMKFRKTQLELAALENPFTVTQVVR